ncbi:MAG TPA: DUF4435 domain-containing protein [Cytophagaceae bacterium]|jgi:hypothetical protein
MPILPAELLDESDSKETAYHQFLLDFQKSDSFIYNFLEGEEDIAYYQLRIRANAPGYHLKLYSCGGKSEVIELCDLIKSKAEYNEIRVTFFIDRDFDPIMNTPNIYETPYHSVENFFTDVETLEQVFRTLFRIRARSQDINACMELYLRLFNDYHDYVLPINAWYSCYIDKRNQNAIIQRVNMNELTKNLFLKVVGQDLNINRVHGITDFAELQLLFGNGVDIDEVTFNNKIEELRAVNPAHNFRGKFEIRFLASFLHVLKHRIEARNNNVCNGRYTCNHAFNAATTMELLYGFAYTPDCLREYIRRIAA